MFDFGQSILYPHIATNITLVMPGYAFNFLTFCDVLKKLYNEDILKENYLILCNREHIVSTIVYILKKIRKKIIIFIVKFEIIILNI